MPSLALWGWVQYMFIRPWTLVEHFFFLVCNLQEAVVLFSVPVNRQQLTAMCTEPLVCLCVCVYGGKVHSIFV